MTFSKKKKVEIIKCEEILLFVYYRISAFHVLQVRSKCEGYDLDFEKIIRGRKVGPRNGAASMDPLVCLFVCEEAVNVRSVD